MQFHDAYRILASQNVAYANNVGASAQSAAFASQTRYIRVCSVGVVSATVDGVRIEIGANPTAVATSYLLPVNWIEIIKVAPGQKLAALGNNASTGSLNLTELTD